MLTHEFPIVWKGGIKNVQQSDYSEFISSILDHIELSKHLPLLKIGLSPPQRKPIILIFLGLPNSPSILKVYIHMNIHDMYT